MTIYNTKFSEIDKQFVSDFLLPTTKRYIFGHNQYSKSLVNELSKRNLKIEAIIDDFTKDRFYTPPNYSIKIPIINTQSLSQGKVVVVVTSQTKSALKKLSNIQKHNKQMEFMDGFSFFSIAREDFGLDLIEFEFFDSFFASKNNIPISTWKDFREHFVANKKEYENIYNQLKDVESKSEFENILNFRLNGNYSFMSSFEFRPKEQYFEDFYKLEDIKIFFDIGAYQGETSLEFIKRVKDYKQIYFFEPEKKNFQIAQNALNKKNIKGFNIGISDKKENLAVKSQTTSSHLVSLDSNNAKSIQVNSIDNLIKEGAIQVNSYMGGGIMLKFDIESSEIYALEGAKNFIREYKPIIAISIYHRYNDFITIPKKILSIYKNYDLYFRHYSSGLTESVMFFIPLKQDFQ
ncbi:MAG: FkbM family methyltransferase [Helicobacteraceae bacterium]|nr:FkbM family methyltransferase [Helicobacteraceae bacterium]